MAETHSSDDDEVADPATGNRAAARQRHSGSPQEVRTRHGGGDDARVSAELHQELGISSTVHPLHSTVRHGEQVNSTCLF